MCGVALVIGCNRERLQVHVDALVRVISLRGPDGVGVEWHRDKTSGLFVCVVASVLWIRGTDMQRQPVQDVETGDVLCWNGELYDIENDDRNVSDTTVLMQRLLRAAQQEQQDQHEVCRVLCEAEGPFAVLWLQKTARRLLFCRNQFGQRSLLISTPRELQNEHITNEPDHDIGGGLVRFESDDDVVIVTSVVPVEMQQQQREQPMRWHEVPVLGVYGLEFGDDSCVRVSLMARYEPLPQRGPVGSVVLADARIRVLQLLRRSVEKRASTLGTSVRRVRLLFSGGVDSCLLAALLHESLPAETEVCLRNVAFGKNPANASDRQQGLAALEELRAKFPDRRWVFQMVNVEDEAVFLEMENVKQVCFPVDTVMDVTIGSVLWFAFGRTRAEDDGCRVCFTGIGADELFGGYARHLARFKSSGGDFEVLGRETSTDVLRIAYRNNGRDDRICGAFALECRHPFLDRDLCRYAMSCPASAFVQFGEAGEGGKRVLRDILRDEFGFSERIYNAPKKAMQFGSRMNHVLKDAVGKKTTGKAKIGEYLE